MRYRRPHRIHGRYVGVILYAVIALAAARGLATMNSNFAAAEPVDAAGDQCTSTSPPAGCHFIHVSRRGAPRYEVTAALYDKNGKPVYTWDRSYLGGDKAPLLWYIAGDGGSLDIKVYGHDGWSGSTSEKKGLTLDRDYCFHVSPLGKVKYTGDSITGNCTAN
jgi:hypothetical protein